MELLLNLSMILVFLGLLFFIKQLKTKYKKNYSFRVLSALVIGLLFGIVIQVILGINTKESISLLTFMSIFGDGYVILLKMIVIPLIFIAMTTSIMNSDDTNSLSNRVGKIIKNLMFTVSIAALVGIAVVLIFQIDGNQLVQSAGINSDISSKSEVVIDDQKSMANTSYADYILGIIPSNLFMMFSGQKSTDTLSVVLFSMFFGYCILQIKKRKPEKVQPFIEFTNSLKEVILSMVKEILKLTPFAILAIMAQFSATASAKSFMAMFDFLLASYVAIIIMFIIHLIIITLNGLSPKQYAKKAWKVMLFGFGSRSSMAAIPLNIETQVQEFGVDEQTASMAASFGASIGQNGCAGIYPAMLAVISAQMLGVPLTFMFIVKLVLIIAISSFGIAGVGGGATFAAVAVLSILGFDVRIVAILVGIEPLIDMARTALNISGAMLAGVVTANKNNTLDKNIYNKEV